MALNWVVHRPGVTAPIIGARNAAQLEDNLGAVSALEESTGGRRYRGRGVPARYPYDFIEYSDAARYTLARARRGPAAR